MNDYRNARKIVNGLDKAEEIAARARKYESFLVEAKPDSAHKGVTTSADKPKDEVAGTPPPAPAAEVKASGVSLFTRLTSLSIPAGALAVVGAIFNFVKGLPPYAWFAMAGVVCVSMVVGYLIWRDSKKQAHERTLLVMDAAADRDKNNLRLI